MSVKPNDPLILLEKQQINEALVLQVVLTPARSFTMVVEGQSLLYKPEAIHPKQSERLFLRLLFCGVEGYQRTEPCEMLHTQNEYDASRDTIGVVIYDSKVTRHGKLFRFRATLSNFGKVSFAFSSLRVERRTARVVGRTTTGDWIYVNQADSTPLDFYHPFA